MFTFCFQLSEDVNLFFVLRVKLLRAIRRSAELSHMESQTELQGLNNHWVETLKAQKMNSLWPYYIQNITEWH